MLWINERRYLCALIGGQGNKDLRHGVDLRRRGGVRQWRFPRLLALPGLPASAKIARSSGKGDRHLCAQHPKGRSGKRCLSPFPARPNFPSLTRRRWLAVPRIGQSGRSLPAAWPWASRLAAARKGDSPRRVPARAVAGAAVVVSGAAGLDGMEARRSLPRRRGVHSPGATAGSGPRGRIPPAGETQPAAAGAGCAASCGPGLGSGRQLVGRAHGLPRRAAAVRLAAAAIRPARRSGRLFPLRAARRVDPLEPRGPAIRPSGFSSRWVSICCGGQ